MRKKGVINNEARRQQIFDFSGFVDGNLSPSDADYLWDLKRENVWIIGELKTAGIRLTQGQRIALTSDLEAHYRDGRHCLGFLAWHYSEPADVVDATRMTVREVWLHPERGWTVLPDRRFLGEFIDSFRKWARSLPRRDKQRAQDATSYKR